MKLIGLILSFIFLSIEVLSQLTVTTGIPAATLVQNTLVGGGVTVSNVSYNGHANAIGRFQTGANPTNLGLTEGIILSTGIVNGAPAIGSPVGGFASTSNNLPGDALLNTLIPSYSTNDATILEFDFIPLSDTIRFRYVFGSEEYPEWVGSSFNDVFGFFVSGPNPSGGNYTNYNIARIPNTTIPVSINSVNQNSNTQYFVHNQNLSGQTIVFDGFTTVLTAWLVVTPCQNYHIKIAIADAGDWSYDSAVFLEANSFGTSGITIETDYSIPAIGNFAVEGCNNAILTFCLPQVSPNNYNIPIQVSGSASNGVDYTQIPSSLIIPAGTLCIDFVIEAFVDNIIEGIETINLVIQTDLCSALDTLVIEIHDYFEPEVVMSPDTTICIGDSIMISSSGTSGVAPYQYLWDNDPLASNSQIVTPQITTLYTVTITDMCSKTASADIEISVATTDVFAGVDQTICSGESATLSASGGLTYIWSTGDSTATISVTPLQTSTYSVTATGVCIPVDSVDVIISPSPEMEISQPPAVCAGENVQITISGAESYIWSANPVDGTLGTQNTSEVINVRPNVTTTYSVTGSNQFGCTGALDVIAEIYPSPEADFIFEPNVASSFEPLVSFMDISTGFPDTWYWDFGDMNYSIMQHPLHQYSDSGGVYPVTLIVANVFGCLDSVTKNVYIRPDYVIYVPNAFSPNNDGINEEIMVFSVGLSESDFEWIIYDRWGKAVYYSRDIHQAWDGKYNNIIVKQGIYSYKLIFRDKTNKLHEETGIIMLVR